MASDSLSTMASQHVRYNGADKPCGFFELRRSRCLFDTAEFQLAVSNPRMVALTSPKAAGSAKRDSSLCHRWSTVALGVVRMAYGSHHMDPGKCLAAF